MLLGCVWGGGDALLYTILMNATFRADKQPRFIKSELPVKTVSFPFITFRL